MKLGSKLGFPRLILCLYVSFFWHNPPEDDGSTIYQGKVFGFSMLQQWIDPMGVICCFFCGSHTQQWHTSLQSRGSILSEHAIRGQESLSRSMWSWTRRKVLQRAIMSERLFRRSWNAWQMWNGPTCISTTKLAMVFLPFSSVFQTVPQCGCCVLGSNLALNSCQCDWL